MTKIVLTFSAIVFVCSGCGSIKAAPDLSQKLNAYLLNKTASQAASLAAEQKASEPLQELTTLCEKQSQAVAAYYGKPADLPEDFDIDSVDVDAKTRLAELAYKNASAPQSYRDIAFDMLDVGIGVCALFGGAFGIKIASFLSKAKTKALALEEIIKGNEKFKSQYPEYSSLFKSSHKNQSAGTRQIVTEVKAS